MLTSTTAIDGIGTITAASLTAGLTGTASKVYDTNTTATLAAGNYTLRTILGADVVSVSGTGAYDTKNVGTGKTRDGERLVLSGADAGNYVLTSTTASNDDRHDHRGEPDGRADRHGVEGLRHEYDGDAGGGNYTLGTILGSDVVSVSGTGAYDTKNVGTGKTVTVSGLVLSGADGGNYVLTSTTASAGIGTITAASLTAGLTGTVSKVYDTNTTATLAAGNYTLSTILGSDVVSVSGTGAYDTKNVGTGKTVTANGLVLSGADAGNYVLTSTTASNTIGTITAASLTAGLTGTVSKVYDTNTTATLAAGNYTLGTILGSDVVSGQRHSASYDTKNVGTGKSVTATGLVLSGADAGNYVLTSTTASNTIGTITAASLTAGLTGTVSKVYDTNTTATLAAGNYTLGTVLGSDVVSVSGTGAYDTKNVGTGKSVTANGLVLSGADAGNYVLTSTTAQQHDRHDHRGEPDGRADRHGVEGLRHEYDGDAGGGQLHAGHDPGLGRGERQRDGRLRHEECRDRQERHGNGPRAVGRGCRQLRADLDHRQQHDRHDHRSEPDGGTDRHGVEGLRREYDGDAGGGQLHAGHDPGLGRGERQRDGRLRHEERRHRQDA